jgi:Uma2 family endonuclease
MSQALRKPPADVPDLVPPQSDFEEGKPLNEEWVRFFRAKSARLVTEDDEPVDNILSEKQMRLLTETLYSSWQPQPDEEHPDEPRHFLVTANVALYFSMNHPPIVPDVLLSLDVDPRPDWLNSHHRAYFVWEFDKIPEVVLEIVSNEKGGELTTKLREYARQNVPYYVVYDPLHELSRDDLRVYENNFGRRYRLRKDFALPKVGLSLRLWDGVFEAQPGRWLRWCDTNGELIPTGAERAERAEFRAEIETARADLAEAEVERLKKELAQLRKQTSGAKGKRAKRK